MGDAVDDIICATDAAVAVEDAASGKPAMLSSLGGQGEEEHEEKDNEDKSGESEVINPPEDAGGEATSPLEGRKPRLSKGNQSHGPNAVKSKSPTSGDEGQTRKKAPNSSLPKAPIVQVSHGDAGVGSNKDGKNESRSSSVDATLLDDSKEKRKTQKPLAQLFSIKSDEEQSNGESAKPRKVGSIPSYGFTFKCDERSEKRREFYSKLEEKIHARELEISNLQAKSKETEEAELKMLRKSLNFKATPMPSFYKEPTPAKVELKKIPPTRAKSPKFGRSKNKSTPETEENATADQPAHLSLEENVSQNGVKKPTPLNPAKKPQRKSLPRLPSEETGPLVATSRQLIKSAKLDAVSAPETGSATGQVQVQGSETETESGQGPVEAGANPDEQDASEQSVV
ncbi:Protein WVD2-like 5 [Zea mays]|uniref:TPX2 C-terminal domain-containing protein n=2 Tax=Zea mays TaxID=4577 RepID=A0A3L6F4P6_MAIZE|nr:hypothetical protein Zm00014a_011770 [Zea mays]PWZ28028.1 hypothetical protein Zm00014a_011770 [Zea mays]PWZ28029.1 Protein WVD2-like 5 [Zea mays]